MPVRSFDGNDEVLLDAAGIDPVGPFTFAWLFEPANLSSFHALIAGRNAGGVAQWNAATGDGNWLAYYASLPAVLVNGAFAIDLSWQICAITKANGVAVPRMHRLPLGGAWTHGNGSDPSGNAGTIAGGHISLGQSVDVASDFVGLLALAGVWDVQLDDGDIEDLAANLATADWLNHASAPIGLWQLNQASTAEDVLDLTGGGADQVGLTGTSVDAENDPPGWEFFVPGPGERTRLTRVGGAWIDAPLKVRVDGEWL